MNFTFKKYIFSLFIVLGLGFSLFASDFIKEIENAISLGNTQLINPYLCSSVEIETPTTRGIFSKSQSEQILDKFFEKYPPISFSIGHKGNSAGGAKFAIGNYVSTRERTFRVTIYIKKNGSDYLIQEIKFE